MQAAGDLMALVQMRDANKPLGWIGQALVQTALANWTAAANLATHAIETTFHVRIVLIVSSRLLLVPRAGGVSTDY